MGGSVRMGDMSSMLGGVAGRSAPSSAPLGVRRDSNTADEAGSAGRPPGFSINPSATTGQSAAGAGVQMFGGIGRSLEVLRQQLLASQGTLASCVEPAGQELVSEAAGLLQKQVCRVAVVGQIKSGKSSFINAFAQQPALLPTDVNPWTTAVTNLHFCQPAPSGSAAIFKFFAEQEWQQLVEGAGRLRELTKRLVPGFEPELLRQHVDALRRRAHARLGDKFTELLGQSHSFDKLDPGLLQQYVCNGDFARTNGADSDQGRYSDITKSADIFCGGGPFEFPVTLVDTPGTNDPFLLRDEVTRASLETADLYIVVLTARRPLSDSDVALLRILRGLHKERILVFINRIDDLAEIGRDVAEVTGFVGRKIAEEFPGAQIPVIAGSARWASCASQPDHPDTANVLQARALAYLTETGRLRREDVVRPAEQDAAQNEAIRRALFEASGMPEAYNALSKMLDTSHCAHVLRQVAQCYGELARSATNSARGELDLLNAEHANAVTTAQTVGQRLTGIDKEVQQLGEMARVIEQSGQNLSGQLQDILNEEADVMRARMTAEVAAHAREEANVLVDTLRRGRAPKVWRCEVGDLRNQLAQEFLSGFDQASRRVLELQARVAPELHQLMSMIAPGDDAPMEPDRGRLQVPSPSLASLGRFVAVDLDAPWWSAWWTHRPSDDDRGGELEALIQSEFGPVIEELVVSAQESLGSYCSMTSRWSFAMCSNLIQSLQRRGEQLRARYQELSTNVDGRADPQTVHSQATQITRLRERLKQCDALSRHLAQISKTITGTLQGATE